MERHKQMLLFFFGVFMSSVHTLGWTNVPVEEGQDAILNCSLGQNVVWYMQLLEGSPVRILRTFSRKTEDVEYYNDTFKDRYSVKLGNRLLIHNVTLEKTRFYYCTDVLHDTTFLNETFHLVSASKLSVPSSSQKDLTFWPLVSLAVVSLALNLILITVLAARCRNKPNHPVTSDSPVNPTYEEIPETVCSYSTLQDQKSRHVGAAVSESQLTPGSSSVYGLCQAEGVAVCL